MRPIPPRPVIRTAGGLQRSGRISRGAALALAVALAAHLMLFHYLAEWRTPIRPVAMIGIPISALVGVGRRLSLPTARPTPASEPSPKPPTPTPTNATRDPDLAPATPLLVDTPVVHPFDTSSLELKRPVVLQPILDAEPIALNKPGGASSTPTAEVQAAPASATVQGAKSCDLFERIQATLQTSEAVLGAVGAIPARSKSVANAVMIWDARWADPASLGGSRVLSPIRQAVLDQIAQSPGACQQDEVRGPRLVIVGDPRDHTVLAFGSGQWRWADLLVVDLQP